MREREWAARAACRKKPLHLFFRGDETPKHEWDKGDGLEGRKICATCPVRLECLEDAIRCGEPYGIRGGFDEKARGRIARGLQGTDLWLFGCENPECRKDFVTEYADKVYCSKACKVAGERIAAAERAAYLREWRAKRKAEQTGELFSVDQLRRHVYVPQRNLYKKATGA